MKYVFFFKFHVEVDEDEETIKIVQLVKSQDALVIS